MANVQGTFYRGETQRSGVTPSSPSNAADNPVNPINPPGSGNTTLYKLLGDTTDKSFIGKNGYVPVVVGENVLTLQPFPNAQADGLISGGIVQWSGTGYIFNVSAALARFQGVYPLNSDPAILTLTTPDATNDRIDLFILQILFDGNGIPNGMEADFITGTPAASPVKPQINPATQIELTSVLVTASSTEPTLTEEVIYDENIEWTGTTSGTGTGVFNSAVDPYQGTVSVETTNIQNGFYVQFNNGTEIDISTYQTFGFQINLKASLGANQNLYVTFLDGSLNAASNFVLINLDKSLTGYQFIGIALNAVNFTSFDVQYIRFSFVRTSGPATFSGYFLDIVKLEGGIAPPVTNNTFLNLTDTPSSYIGQAGKTVAVKADETGLEFVTGGGGGITGSGTTNEIAYFTGATSIGSLTTATYPSLTELSYVKGVTSAIQTQINGKQATIAGALTEGYVATIVGGVPTWAAASGGGSNWTVVGSDIYRNSAVAIGRTTIPGGATLGVQSITSTNAFKYIQFLNNAGTEQFSLTQQGNFFFTCLGGRSVRFIGVTSTVGQFVLFEGSGTSTSIAIKLTHAGVTTLNILGNGSIAFEGSGNLSFTTTTGTKIGTTTSQKLAFWNKTPIIQPTNAITAAAFVANTSGIVDDSATYGGYTMGQIAAALINTGILA